MDLVVTDDGLVSSGHQPQVQSPKTNFKQEGQKTESKGVRRIHTRNIFYNYIHIA